MGRFFAEAESFENLGGWVVDQQSMNIMGSSYIMAHGLGYPVADAVTHIKLPESGKWYAYVRTRDWTAVWKLGTPAGTFKLMIDDNCFENTLGTNGEEWDWQYAGAMELEGGKTHRMSLRDLTGFNGRCDAVFLTTDKNDIPKNTEEFRREVSGVTAEEDETLYDMVVCGGGIAGTCMALAAVREGINVCLIQDRPVLGGCNSSEIKVGLGGQVRSEPYPNLGNVLQDISPVFGSPGSFDGHFYEDERKANAFYTAKVWANGRYTLALNERVIALEKNGDKISSVTTKNIYTGKIKKYKGRLFADCTGDAVLARLGGADVMYGREAADEYNEQLAPEKADNQVMGMTVTWYSEETDEKDDFPDIDWGIEFDENRSYKVFGGDWEWEAGQYRDMADETEYIRDYSLMTVFGNWSFLKNRYSKKEEYAFRRLKWASPLGGKRESYRVKGDLVLNENDIENHIPHEDETASATWDIDIHYPDPMNVKLFPEPFRSCAIHRGIGRHYPVPYRCLYSKDISNLFLGGRIISTTHIAFSCVRVMRTLGVLGEVRGASSTDSQSTDSSDSENTDPQNPDSESSDTVVSRTSSESSGGGTITVTETKNVPYDASKNPLQRGVNFSDFEYDDIEIGYDNWIFQSKYYDAVREKGFDHIRLPVNFFCHMGSAPDYKIDEEFLRKIDTIVNIAISSNLKIVLDFHHFGELQTNVNGNKQKYYKMWQQLAEHYQNYPSGLVFELFNEPGNADAISKGGPDIVTPEKLIEIQEEAIKIIRKTNPTRLIVHATCWNDGAAQLMTTEPLLPDDDNLIMSVHSYEPMAFTHQGADWNNTGNPRPSTDFTEDMKYEIQLIFEMVKNYHEKYGRPVWIGEFGTLKSKAPEGARAKYADFIVETMKDAGCGWCWWEFQSGFGLYNTTRDEWVDDALMAALMK